MPQQDNPAVSQKMASAVLENQQALAEDQSTGAGALSLVPSVLAY